MADQEPPDRATADSRLARRLQARELVIGTSWRGLRRRGVDLRPRLVSAVGRHVRFADGSQQDVDVVVWATGFPSHYDWLAIPGAVIGDLGPQRARLPPMRDSGARPGAGGRPGSSAGASRASTGRE